MPVPKIITNNVFPPIPDRQFDWVAYRDGTEERGNYGYGPTEEAAIADLTDLEAAEAIAAEDAQREIDDNSWFGAGA
jgi:hypothetical protein